MTFTLKTRHALLAAALVAAPAAALAQNDVDAQANQVAAEAQDLQQARNELATTVDQRVAEDDVAAGRDADEGRDRRDGDRDFPWGLLGLIGLAGLLGLRGRDHDHVDRRDYDRTTTGTTTGTTARDTDTRL